jgi:NCS1 family nucleobase:cation symporter-1
VLYQLAPCLTGAAQFVNFIVASLGPVFWIMMVDYYLIRKGVVDVPALYREDGEFRFQNGWHAKAFVAFVVGAIFSSVLPTFTDLLPAWWKIYGWFFGVAIGGGVYYALRAGAARK